MQKVKTITVEYKNPVHLFRGELLAIESILKEDLVGRGFRISFDSFDSDSVSSIPSDQETSDGINFHIDAPYFSVEVRRYSSRFYASENSLQIRGAIEKIKEIFDKSTRKSTRIHRWIGSAMGGIAVLIGAFLSVTFIGDIEILKNIAYRLPGGISVLAALTFLCVVSCWQMNWPLEPIIEFEMRSNRKSFWEKNREQIYVGLIVGVPVAIASFVLGRLI